MNKSALMERAIHLALKGSFTTKENPNVGCLIYKNGMIISEDGMSLQDQIMQK